MSVKVFMLAKVSVFFQSLQFPQGAAIRTTSRNAGRTCWPVQACVWSLSVVCLATSLHAVASDLAIDARGNLFVVTGGSNVIRATGEGDRLVPLLDSHGNQIAFDAHLTSIAVDRHLHHVYVSDFDEIYRLNAQGEIALVAGKPSAAYSGIEVPEGQPATETALRDVVALAYDTLSSTLYAAEYEGRILAIQHGRVRQYPSGVASDAVVAGSMSEGSRFRPPIRDIALGPDGSLYVADQDRIWRILAEESTVLPIAGPAQGPEPGPAASFAGTTIPGITGIAVLGERLYASTVGAEILEIGPDGNTRMFASGKIPAGRIEFDTSAKLWHLSGNPLEFKIEQITSDGSNSRLVSSKKPTAVLPQRRIIGGTPVPRNELQAVVQMSWDTGSCTGSLIAPTWVLTAAHCVQDEEGALRAPLTVSVCNEVPDDCAYANVPVRGVHPHPEYVDRGLVNFSDLPSVLRQLIPQEVIERGSREQPFDIALAELERPIHGVTKIDLADFTTEQLVATNGTEAIQVGWGNTNYSLDEKRYPNHKRMITTPVRHAEQCRDSLVHSASVRALASATNSLGFLDSINDLNVPLWNHRVCAGSPRSPVELASWGDSGGPLLVSSDTNVVQIGVLSSARPRLDLTSAVFLNVYTRTSEVYDWIEQLTGVGRNHSVPIRNDDALRQDLTSFRECDACPAMAVLPTGTFEMGAPPSELGSLPREGPPQAVTIPRRVAMGVREVTFREWYRCVDDGGCTQRPDDRLIESDRPVVNVSYRDTIEYTAWLGRKTGRPYRLPTESEWEYAARAGTSTPFYTGADISPSDANYGTGSPNQGSTALVGSYGPNPWGLHDVAGNASELVQDCFHDTLEGTDRRGRSWQMSGCSRRVVRGGAWFVSKYQVRSASRSYVPTVHRASWVGFRVARTLQDSASVLPPADDHGDRQSATPLALGSHVRGHIERGDDEDWFRLTLSERASIAIYTAGGVNTVGSLRDGLNREIQGDDDSDEGTNFRLAAILGPGTYYVRVTSFSSGTGSYTLHAVHTGAGPEAPERFTNSIGMEFARVPAGEFMMGSTGAQADRDESPITHVRISLDFYVGTTEVTQGQWQAVMGSNPSWFSNCGADCPVEGVSWNDVAEFVVRLNAMEGGTRYRLLTEAEWEYAARAGTTSERHGSSADAIAWHSGNSGGRTHPVGQKTANAFGLYDMLGNVWEWVQDWYGDYPGGTVTDPTGPRSGTLRVERGGGWGTSISIVRAPNRYRLDPDRRSRHVGLRLAWVSETPIPPDSPDDHADERNGATPLALDASVTGRIETAYDEDWFRLDVTEQTAVAVYTTGALDTTGSLQHSSNPTVQSDDNSGADENFRIEATLAPGTHYVQVRSGSNRIGRYTLHAEVMDAEPLVADLSYDFEFDGTRIGTIERIAIAVDDSSSSQLSLAITARLHDFARTFDQIFDGFRIPWDSCQNRVFFAGNTRVRSTGQYLKFSTDIRYERWNCFLRDFRIFSITRSVVLRIDIVPGAIEDLSFAIELEDVEGLWDWLEDRILNLRQSYSYPLPIPWSELGSPCSLSDVSRLLNPSLESTLYSAADGDIRVVATFAVDKDLARASSCLP